MPFHLWLRHIAKDHMIDAHRRHRQAQRRSLDREQPIVPAGLADQSSLELAGQFLDQEMTPATAAIRHELQRRMQEAVASLEEDDREIILMRHYEQLSNQEVALALGLSEAAASMRHLRAVRRLRRRCWEKGSRHSRLRLSARAKPQAVIRVHPCPKPPLIATNVWRPCSAI